MQPMLPGPGTHEVACLYRDNKNYVHQALLRYGVPNRDCADQVHEVFIVVARNLSTYRREGVVTTWLHGIARRVAAAYRRKAQTRREVLTDTPRYAARSQDCPFESLARAQARRWVVQIFAGMTTEQRTAYQLFEVQGLTGQEIADQLGVPLQTVFSRLRRARRVYDRHVLRIRAGQEPSPVDRVAGPYQRHGGSEEHRRTG